MDEAALADFAAALRDPSRPVPPGLRAWNGSDPAVRLAVHRNTVTVSLLQALREAFPVLRRSLGERAFDALALAQVRQDPPTSPVLAHYGQRWVTALAGQPTSAGPACPTYTTYTTCATHPAWVADLARLEQARIDAWHAPDAPALDATELARRTADPQGLPGARLRLHPSVRLLRLHPQAVALWQQAHTPASASASASASTPTMNPRATAAAQTDGPNTAAPPVHLLLLRDPQDRVPLLPLPAADAALLQALHDGQTLGTALHAARQPPAPDDTPPDTPHDNPPDLGRLLALLLRHGALVDWLAPDPPA